MSVSLTAMSTRYSIFGTAYHQIQSVQAGLYLLFLGLINGVAFVWRRISDSMNAFQALERVRGNVVFELLCLMALGHYGRQDR